MLREIPLTSARAIQNIPGRLRQAEQQAVACHRQTHLARAAQTGQRLLRMMEMIYRERFAGRVLGLSVQPFGPDASESVALR